MSAPQPTDRFRPSRRVLVIDRFMTHFIKVGGIGIIVAVLGMLVFIVAKVLPLFKGAEVSALDTPLNSEASPALVLGIDEWGELPFLIDTAGTLRLFPEDADPITHTIADGRTITAASFAAKLGIVIVALDDGSLLPITVGYGRDVAAEGSGARVTAATEVGEPLTLDLGEGTKISHLAFAESEGSRLIAVLAETGDKTSLHTLRYKRKRSLLGDGELKLDSADDLSDLYEDDATHVTVNSAGDSVILATAGGKVLYLFATSDGFELRQRFRPFQDEAIGSIDYLLGDNSLSLVSTSGEHIIYSLFKTDDEADRLFGETKRLDPLGGAPTAFVASQRNRSFLVAAGNKLSLRFSTSTTTRWEDDLDFEPQLLALNQKQTRIVALGSDGLLRGFDLRDPHPEAGLRTFFGKIWYEDSPGPAFVWQSTGGSDEFEPKLSLVPLIFGTLKGTFYAMLFALPIALLAAIYTSQFLHPNIKAVVKPVMEIMASLPSVVLGFLGALWLAPKIEHHTVSLLLIVLFVPLGAFLLGWLWIRFPIAIRSRVKPGYEFVVLVPLLLLGVWICWHAGPWVEHLLFTYTNSEGTTIDSFKAWWTDRMGLRFEQRNCVIIGIMMGFAVIPIIFTITEDALSSVPNGLRSASLACGASRWQTAWRVVLPTASAGIFSATMIGLGRAVGETMIVVMATGNTPIMEANIFSGMRTLSANIAVELPEAPENGTLYRTLFLGALVLFLMTFVLNTAAEVLRQHLREKYKTV